jgi:PAS domain S-box-containing protein
VARTARAAKSKKTPPARRTSAASHPAAEGKLAAAFRLSPAAIVITSLPDGRCLEVNDAFTRITGYTREEALGHTMRELGVWENPADRNQLIKAIRLAGSIRDQEFAFRHKTGRRGIGLVSAEVIDVAGEPCLIVMAQDITQHKLAKDTLQTYANDLQVRNEDLDAFAHTVAHDLKSPLGNIIGFVEWLQARPDMPAGERQDYVNVIARNALKMDNIIDELLLLARVRQGDVESMPLDMARIVAEAQQRLTFMIAETHARICTPQAWPTAIGYAPWVEEVWVNYLSNAIKYGGQLPVIELGCDLAPDNMIRFWVRDNGSGIAPEAHQHLFTPFSQLSEARATGHGLGLSIVKHIIEKMGGTVEAHSSQQGSTFSFTLPAA